MNNLFRITVGLATIAGIGFASYQIGMAQTTHDADSIKINIDNTIDGVISNVAQENRQGIEELLAPLLELIESNLNENSASVDNNELVAAAGKFEKTLSEFSLKSYQAGASPFVPPLNKVQFLCGEVFTLAYTGQHFRNTLTSNLKVNSNNISMTPGDIKEFKQDNQVLTITDLEYKKELKGPLLKYECKE
jgi:hypothetical protein